MRPFIFIALVSCLLVPSSLALLAQEPARQTASKAIKIGQEIADTQRLLRARGEPISEGGLALAQTDPDEAHLQCILDERSAFAAIFYSKSTKKVTHISVIFHPEGNPTKADRVWVPATGIVLHEDRSFAIEFPAPATVIKQ
jgi:hypothetical protein